MSPTDAPAPHPGQYAPTGLFLALEGGEGAGKSTQAGLLSERLRSAGHRVRLTHEPGDTPVGATLRGLVLDPATGAMADRTEALLYAADKAEHVERVVRPALGRGEVVITDRYVDSTLAYQGAGRDLDASELEAVARWATEDLRPHLTVLLDLDPGAGLTRLSGRDRIEAESHAFHARVREGFLALAARTPERYLVLDATASAQAVGERVWERVSALLDTPVGAR